jgi:hypothetical protein
MRAFAAAVGRSATPSIIAHAFAEGFQQRTDFELNLGAYIGKVAAEPDTVPTR